MSSRTPWSQHTPELKQRISDKLTIRQHNTLVLWLAGVPTTRIADMLGIQTRTARTHLKRARTIYDSILEKEQAA